MKTTSRILALLLAILMALSVFAMAGCSSEGDNGAATETEEAKETKKTETPKKTETTKKTDFYGTDWINAAEFGMVGDGRTLNDAKFADYAKYYSDTPLYFPEGVYCFEKTLNFPDSMYVRMDPEAELKCVAKEPLEYFITLRGQFQETEGRWVNFLDYAHQAGIEGGTINANYKAKCALGLFQGMHSIFRDLKVMNVLEKGIQTKISKTSDGCYHFENIYVYNSECRKGTYGIYDNHVDNHFMYVTCVNFETSFYTNGGRFVECSGWNLAMESAESMTFAEIHGSQSIWIGPSVDTVRYGFKLAEGASTSISDLVYITNKVFYTEELQKKYPRTLFWAEDPENAKFMVTGCQINWEKYLDFSNAPLPNSSFVNLRIPAGMNGAQQFKNYRDDNAIIRDLNETEAQNTADFYLSGKSDFNKITADGIYKCSLGAGKGGKNLPPKAEKGVLEVTEKNDVVLQKFFGQTYSAYRIYSDSKWSNWIITTD